ncbi:NADH dehydrogenase [ubiquinone] 1 beta subcomplex subunit 9-like [Mizuhopecten yessoensis]|uniref:NADH dehydrogenase [ubiquinone] 1 beta subcomplex subunit 9 n=1 Tax=Mizuhopecten yessoensis TaxID=6573 RepID=A0A210QME4_MIZYE|nr:NADH dehydrogenase [ubiquinone] 1 beta subcomplex subunit 9-like [Mizuhopecten yessoensis]OWF49888.1 NADH dehydrogenase [ubiquinone] 1 beta subcomplex subunit 9 [Mizuhopecten yessoensis]
MSYMKTKAFSHAQLVKTLFKKVVRAHETTCGSRLTLRSGAVHIRAMFDRHKDERDMAKVEKMMEQAERYIHWVVPKRKQYDHCPGGIAHGRYEVSPDMVLDNYHPMEKAAYPKYFAKRELAKRDYILWWEKTYGNTEAKTN